MSKEKVPAKTEDQTFANSQGANYKQSENSGKKYTVVYKNNGSRELYVAGMLMRFEAHRPNPVFPRQYGNGLPEWIVKHPDFVSAESEFTVREI